MVNKLNLMKKPLDWSADDYLFYLYQNKVPLGLSWDDIADIMNKYEKCQYGESKYRKYCKAHFDLGANDQEIEYEDEPEELTISEKFDIAKEIQRLRDERTQLNLLYRQSTREEYLKDIAVECASIIAKDHKITIPEFAVSDTDREGILLISDWHYGITVDNHWNRYDPNVCVDRLGELILQVGRFVNLYGIGKITVLNLGDLISGRIHSQIRIENKEDVVSQTMEVSELLAQFLTRIAKLGVKVEYYDCLDNHSRVEPNKKESLRLESFARFITWFLQERFKDTDNININFNKYSDEIITFKCLGWNVAGVHGDLDTQKKVVQNMRGMLEERPSLICTAHMHHFSANEENACIVISNPSLMGTDQYAESKRYTSSPAQTLIVATKQTPVYAIHRIVCE